MGGALTSGCRGGVVVPLLVNVNDCVRECGAGEVTPGRTLVLQTKRG